MRVQLDYSSTKLNMLCPALLEHVISGLQAYLVEQRDKGEQAIIPISELNKLHVTIKIENLEKPKIVGIISRDGEDYNSYLLRVKNSDNSPAEYHKIMSSLNVHERTYDAIKITAQAKSNTDFDKIVSELIQLGHKLHLDGDN